MYSKGLLICNFLFFFCLCLDLVPDWISLSECHNKISQTKRLKHEFMSSQFWSLEVQDQSARRVGFLWGLFSMQMATLLLPLHMVFSLLMHFPGTSFLINKSASHTGFGSHPNDLFSLNYLFKNIILRYSYIFRC